MADVALFTVSAGLTIYLPSRLSNGAFDGVLLPVKVVLGLSFILFSVSVLEATPSRWLLLLSMETRPKREDVEGDAVVESLSSFIRLIFTVKNAYIFVLWMLATLILLIHPATIGTFLLGRIFSCSDLETDGNRKSLDHAETKKKTFLPQNTRQHSLLFRLTHKGLTLMFLAVRFAFKLLFGWIGIGLGKIKGRLVPSRENSVLALTQQDLPRSSTWCRPPLSTSGYPQTRLTGTILGSLCGVGATIAVLDYICPHVVGLYSENATALSKAVSWMCALGIVISAILNGFGSVSMPYACLAGLYLEPIRAKAVTDAEEELRKARESLEERKSALSSTKLDVRTGAPTNLSTWRTSTFSDLGDEFAQRRKALTEEISFLETLVVEMSDDLVEMRNSQKMAIMARTPLGRLRSYLGVAFSLILLIRLMSAVMIMWSSYGIPLDEESRRPQGDIITRVLLWLLGHDLMTSQDFQLFSQFISLALSAFLSFSQVRMFIRIATAVSRRLYSFYQKCYCYQDEKQSAGTHGSDDLSFATGLYVPLLASLMGCYFIACVLLTKMMVPKKYRAGLSAALGGSPDALHIHAYTVNSIFAVSALVSAMILGMLLGIQRQNTYRHQTWTSGPSHQRLEA